MSWASRRYCQPGSFSYLWVISIQIIFIRNYLKNYEIIFGWRMTEFLYSFWPKILFREKFSKQFLLLMSEWVGGRMDGLRRTRFVGWMNGPLSNFRLDFPSNKWEQLIFQLNLPTHFGPIFLSVWLTFSSNSLLLLLGQCFVSISGWNNPHRSTKISIQWKERGILFPF